MHQNQNQNMQSTSNRTSSLSPNPPAGVKPHKKRIITEARKIQNREAQRAYRQRQKAQKETNPSQEQLQPNFYTYQHLQPHPTLVEPSDPNLVPGDYAASWNFPIRGDGALGSPQPPGPSHVAAGVTAADPLDLTGPLLSPGTSLVDGSGSGLSLSPLSVSNPQLQTNPFDLGRTEMDMESTMEPGMESSLDMELDPRIFQDLNTLFPPSTSPLPLDYEVESASHVSNSASEYDEWLGMPVPMPISTGDEQLMLSFAQENERAVASSIYNHRMPAALYSSPSNPPLPCPLPSNKPESEAELALDQGHESIDRSSPKSSSPDSDRANRTSKSNPLCPATPASKFTNPRINHPIFFEPAPSQTPTLVARPATIQGKQTSDEKETVEGRCGCLGKE